MDENGDAPVAGPSTLHPPPMEEVEETEMLARRRSRRSTAGNRYEAAKAEMGLEDSGMEMEPDPDKDDVEFVVLRDEEDIFDNDFASTDEEEEQMDGAKGALAEKEAREDERPARKSTRSRVAQQTALAAARHRSTFQPPTTTTSTPTTKRVRLMLGPSSTTQGKKGTRQSSRKSTIQVRSETSRRLREGARKTRLRRTLLHLHQQAHDPSSSGAAEGGVRYSQTELIQRALDNEEGNIRSHREYLAVEEEKRRKATAVRRVGVEGEGVRWVSRVEERVVPAFVPKPEMTPKKQQQPSASGFVLQLAPDGYAPPPPPTSSPQADTAPAEPRPEAETATEKQTHNYLLHSLALSSSSPSTKPTWSQTMSALFGSHVDWGKVRVWPASSGSRGRPLSRPIPKCVITGLPAKYIDPRTGCPYADTEAFRVLTKVLEHEYVWSAGRKGGVYLSVPPPASSGSDGKGKEKMFEMAAEKTGMAAGTAEEPIEIDMHMDVEVEEGIVRRALKAAA